MQTMGEMWTLKNPYRILCFVFGTTINWEESKQSMVTLSTTQVKYIILIEGVKEVIWLRDMIEKLWILKNVWRYIVTVKMLFNWSIIKCIMKGQNTFDIHFHFTKNMIELRKILVKKVASKENLEHVFTKSLSRSRFKWCLNLVKIVKEWFKFWRKHQSDW